MSRPVTQRFFDTALPILCVAWILIHLLALMVFGYGRDQGIYAYVGRVILEGGMPYRDAWDYKTPGIFLLYAATRIFFGSRMWGIRLVEALGLIGMVAAMVRLTTNLWGSWRLGLLAGALAVGTHVQLDFWHTAQPESFGGMLLVVALLLTLRREGDTTLPPRESLRLLGAGLLFGVMALFKPTLVAPLAVVAGWRAWERRSPWPALLLAAGFVVPPALCLAWFAATGALPAAIETFTGFVPRYNALGWQGQDVLSITWHTLSDWLTKYSSALALGVALLVVFFPPRGQRRNVLLVALVILAELIGVALQAKFFAYHFGAVWPPTALLAALGWWQLGLTARDHGVVGTLGWLGLLGFMAFLLTAGPRDLQHPYAKRLQLRLAALFDARAPGRDGLDAVHFWTGEPFMQGTVIQDAARRIRAVVPPDRTLYVWGFEPGLYDRARLRAPTRYFYNQAPRLALTKDAARRELMADLERNPPGAIVVVKKDRAFHVLGDSLDSAQALKTFPELEQFIAARYVPPFQVGYLDVYLDKTLK